jgi:hypothetical protein
VEFDTVGVNVCVALVTTDALAGVSETPTTGETNPEMNDILYSE